MAGRVRLFTDQQLTELHAQGLHDREIGEKLGAARTTVKYHRKKLGLKAHSPRIRRQFKDEQLIELHDKGFNDREKSDILRTDRNLVAYHRVRLGLKPIRKHGTPRKQRAR